MNGDCQTLPLYQGSGWPFVLLSTAAPPQAPGLPIYRRYRTLLELAGTIGVDPLVLERDWVLTEIVFHLAQTSGAHLVLKACP